MACLLVPCLLYALALFTAHCLICHDFEKQIKYFIIFVLTWYDFLGFERTYNICVDLNILKTCQIISKILNNWLDSKQNHEFNLVLMICKHFS